MKELIETETELSKCFKKYIFKASYIVFQTDPTV